MYHKQLFRGKKVNTQYKHIKFKVNVAFRNAKNKTICAFFFFFKKTNQGLSFLLKNKLILLWWWFSCNVVSNSCNPTD